MFIMENEKYIRIPADKMKSEFNRILIKHGFSGQRAEELAEIFTINSLEGVSSHGVNRFPRFVKSVINGFVKTDVVPTLSNRSGSTEQWNGNLGPGPLNAAFATERAMELALENGIGMVSLANTNHWMRGGTYGQQAAGKGYVLICWTNTCPNMPAWGARDPRIGNNPFVIAVPFEDNSIVLDFAMSQYSYGKLESYKNEERKLPYPGGFNNNGELTSDPGEILESWRILPTGFWKGSAMSLLLDIMAAIFSGGQSTHQIKSCITESGLSQVFIAINITAINNSPAINKAIAAIIDDLHGSVPDGSMAEIRYPGEKTALIRNKNLKEGIQVGIVLWEKILSL